MNVHNLLKKLGTNIESGIKKNIEKSDYKKITEIRLRVNRKVIVLFGNIEKEINLLISKEELQKILLQLTDYSIYTFEEDIKKGFFTVSGGHRIGVCGKIITSNDNITNITNISSLIVRVSNEIIGVSDDIFKHCVPYKNILVISPPCCGKTTLIRDLTRNLSNSGANITVIDERSEICGMYMGEPQNDIGSRTDVLDSCPKDIGISMAIRTNNPNIIVLDEIGTNKDLLGLYNAFNSGVKILATVHSDDLESFREKKAFKTLINDRSIDLYLVLSRSYKNEYKIQKYNKNFEVIA